MGFKHVDTMNLQPFGWIDCMQLGHPTLNISKFHTILNIEWIHKLNFIK